MGDDNKSNKNKEPTEEREREMSQGQYIICALFAIVHCIFDDTIINV